MKLPDIGQPFPCRTVAEISNNHNGSLDRAVKLIHTAKNVGADILKFQCYAPDELVLLRGDGPAPEPWGSEGWTMRKLYEKARTPFEWFPTLIDACERADIPWFSSVFGEHSARLMVDLGCPALKLASLDYGDLRLRDIAYATGLPIIQSSPLHMAPTTDALHLYCPPGYPQRDLKLSTIRKGRYDGFSYHGTDPMIGALAVTQGAKLVECHFQLDGDLSELEPNVSLTASEFRVMVQEIRKVESVL